MQVDSKVDLHEVINKLGKIFDWDHKILSVNFHSLVFWFMGYWVYELLDLSDHELMGSLIWFVGFMNFVGYKFLMLY